MFHIRLIKYFYLGLTILALICPVKLLVSGFLPGILLMWFIYLIFCRPLKSSRIELPDLELITSANNGRKLIIIITIIYLIFYPLYIQFYTGLSLISALKNVLTGNSNYSIYQLYFQEAGLKQFSFIKLPFIIGHGILRFFFIAIVFRTLIYKNKSSGIEKLAIFIMTIIIIIVGFARGTSFELFELFLIFLFASVARNVLSGQKRIISKKGLIIVSAISIIFISYFIYNVNLRMGSNFSYLNDTSFNKDSLLYNISPTLALMIFSLYGYFLFGIYFSSVAITELWFSSFNGFFSALIPNGIRLFSIDKGYRDFVGKFINLGAKWNSDIMVMIESYGLVLTFLFIFLLGYFSRKIYSKININGPSIILIFYTCYIMLSLPIGNFITSSSANIISIFIAFTLYKFNYINRYFYRQK